MESENWFLPCENIFWNAICLSDKLLLKKFLSEKRTFWNWITLEIHWPIHSDDINIFYYRVKIKTISVAAISSAAADKFRSVYSTKIYVWRCITILELFCNFNISITRILYRSPSFCNSSIPKISNKKCRNSIVQPKT